MAATWDSAYLLSMFNRKAGRPSSGDTIDDLSKYQRLSESQNRVVAMLSGIMPQVLYPSAIPTLTTADGGYTFTFGTDANGYNIAPMGKAGIYDNLASIPYFPWVDGVQYLDEGTRIRIPNNGTYSGTLWWRGITPPADIDATHQPALFPEASRELIVMDAVRQFAGEPGGDPATQQTMQGEWEKAWPQWCLVWRTQFRHGGALGTGFTGFQLALGSAGGYSL